MHEDTVLEMDAATARECAHNRRCHKAPSFSITRARLTQGPLQRIVVPPDFNRRSRNKLLHNAMQGSGAINVDSILHEAQGINSEWDKLVGARADVRAMLLASE